MKKLLLCLTLVSALSSFAQYEDYNPMDSVRTIRGYWTGAPISADKDSVSGVPATSSRRTYNHTVLAPNVAFPRVNTANRLEVPSSVFWLDANGYAHCSDASRFPLTASQVTAAVGPIPSYTAGTGISITSNVLTNTAPDKTVTITYASGAGTVTSSYPGFTLTPYAPATYSVTRAINSSTFAISARESFVNYTIKISNTTTLGGNSLGRVLFQYSLNGGSTWIDGPEIENQQNYTLAVTVGGVNSQTSSITCFVPAAASGAIGRLVPTTTASGAGSVTITWVRGSERY